MSTVCFVVKNQSTKFVSLAAIEMCYWANKKALQTDIN